MFAPFRKYMVAIVAPSIVTVLLNVSPCLAQSPRGNVITNVPFPFVVGDRAMPPGRYTVMPIGDKNLRIYTDKLSVIFQIHGVAGNAPEGIANVVFHRVGGTYFLSEIWVASRGTGSQLFPSRAERKMAQGAGKEVAVLRAEPVSK